LACCMLSAYVLHFCLNSASLRWTDSRTVCFDNLAGSRPFSSLPRINLLGLCPVLTCGVSQ
jgi:hypothetical protein